MNHSASGGRGIRRSAALSLVAWHQRTFLSIPAFGSLNRSAVAFSSCPNPPLSLPPMPVHPYTVSHAAVNHQNIQPRVEVPLRLRPVLPRTVI